MGNDVIRIKGARELEHLLEELPKRVRTRGLRQAMTAAAKPTVAAAKTEAPMQSGLLKKSITRKIKQYRGGTAVAAIIGSRREAQGAFGGKKRVPANYFHLIEEGTSRGVAGKHMLRRAYDSTKGQAANIAMEKLKSVLEAQAANLRAT